MSNNKPDPSRTVLIGDTSQERFLFLEKILCDGFRLQSELHTSFSTLEAKAVEAENDDLPIIIADDLPFSRIQKKFPLNGYFFRLGRDVQSPLICIVGGEKSLKLESRPTYLHVPRVPPISDLNLHNDVTAVLCGIGLQYFGPPRLPDLLPDNISDRTMREQIRSLSDQRDLDDGRQILQYLISSFFNCDNATVERLGQGLSGARVFLLHIKIGSANSSYVLKLTPSETRWKLVKEAEKHEQARNVTKINDLRAYLPQLHPCLDSQDHPFIASYSNWAAVCYDYLGGENLGIIIDLETLLVCSLEELSDKTRGSKLHTRHFNSGNSITKSRSNLFGEFLNWLCDEWCPANGGIKRGERRLWLPDDCPLDWSPYELKGRDTGRILSFLDSKDAGKVAGLLPGWDDHRNRVWEFVENKGHLIGQTALNQLMPVTLALVHGDMNSNNVMLWLQHPDHPLLIDFPFFQESGHAMQDFARLEIEIIYALMDCQAENAKLLKASDHTHSQLRLWIQLINHLLDENSWQKQPAWKNRKLAANAGHCLDLIQLLTGHWRKQAAQICVFSGHFRV